MSLIVCDDTFYWFLTVQLEPEHEDDEERAVRVGLALPAVAPTLNLWPCRKCGAMVHGGLRAQHRKFHEVLEAATP